VSAPGQQQRLLAEQQHTVPPYVAFPSAHARGEKRAVGPALCKWRGRSSLTTLPAACQPTHTAGPPPRRRRRARCPHTEMHTHTPPGGGHPRGRAAWRRLYVRDIDELEARVAAPLFTLLSICCALVDHHRVWQLSERLGGGGRDSTTRMRRRATTRTFKLRASSAVYFKMTSALSSWKSRRPTRIMSPCDGGRVTRMHARTEGAGSENERGKEKTCSFPPPPSLNTITHDIYRERPAITRARVCVCVSRARNRVGASTYRRHPHLLPHVPPDVAQPLHTIKALRLETTATEHAKHLRILCKKKLVRLSSTDMIDHTGGMRGHACVRACVRDTLLTLAILTELELPLLLTLVLPSASVLATLACAGRVGGWGGSKVRAERGEGHKNKQHDPRRARWHEPLFFGINPTLR
jgi:hypothetical protein